MRRALVVLIASGNRCRVRLGLTRVLVASLRRKRLAMRRAAGRLGRRRVLRLPSAVRRWMLQPQPVKPARMEPARRPPAASRRPRRRTSHHGARRCAQRLPLARGVRGIPRIASLSPLTSCQSRAAGPTPKGLTGREQRGTGSHQPRTSSAPRRRLTDARVTRRGYVARQRGIASPVVTDPGASNGRAGSLGSRVATPACTQA